MSNEAIEQWTSKDGKERLSVFCDMDAQNPREEWDHFAIMALFHRRYDLANESDMNAEEVAEFIKNDNIIAFPIWGYDHGGLTISMGDRSYPFNDQWDSGFLGFIYCEKNKESMSDEKIKEIMKAEVNIYDQYLTGDVYGYTMEELKKYKEIGGEEIIEEWNTVDSCWGFYGIESIKEKFAEFIRKAK